MNCISPPTISGDLVKKETGKTPQEHIQLKLVDKAKELLCATNKSVSEIAYELGFEYPHHLSRMFRRIRDVPRMSSDCQRDAPCSRMACGVLLGTVRSGLIAGPGMQNIIFCSKRQ